jgi:hypothetical protein
MKPTIFSNRQAVMKTISSLVLALATVCVAAAQTPLHIGFVDPALPKNPPPRNAAALAIDCDPSRFLKSVELRATCSEAVIGLAGMTALAPKAVSP